MTVQLKKVDGELSLTIPADMASAAGLTEGGRVTVRWENGTLTARPVPRPRPTIDELVAGITAENMHGEWDTGPAVGNEVW